jgi:DNA-binding beta-propeller fold protein YncE
VSFRAVCVAIIAFVFAGRGAAAEPPPLALVQTISLPNVTGRIDHLAIDLERQRLFVAALGHDSVEVIDLKAGKVIRALSGLAEPQGVVFVSAFNRLYVANGGDGALRSFDGTSLAVLGVLRLGDDADNLRYDSAAHRLYVGYGSALAAIDPESNQRVGDVALPGHPESFQLEPKGSRIFINVPHAHAVVVVDRQSMKVGATWALNAAMANYPMAFDASSHRLYVACRSPASLLVFDSDAGREIARVTLAGDCDDIFVDPERHQLYASCGAGYIDVFSLSDREPCVARGRITTVAGARTCLFSENRLFLAAPQRGGHEAQVRIYAVR